MSFLVFQCAVSFGPREMAGGPWPMRMRRRRCLVFAAPGLRLSYLITVHTVLPPERAMPCVACNLSALAIPHALSWVRVGGEQGYHTYNDLSQFDATHAINRTFNLEHYWERAEQGTRGLRAACKLHQTTAGALLATLHDKARRHVSTGLALPGVLIMWVGDSFARETWNQLVRSVSGRDLPQLLPSHLNYTFYNHYHQNHLLCCSAAEATRLYARSGDSEAARAALGAHCTVEFEENHMTSEDKTPVNLVPFNHTLHDKLGAGELCAVWLLEHIFTRAQRSSVRSLVTHGVAPDMLIRNGGLHYYMGTQPKEHVKSGLDFGSTFAGWFDDSVRAMKLAPLMHLVIVSSTANNPPDEIAYAASAWAEQAVAYERIRAAVGALPEEFRRRTSYIDFHSLAGTDRCGFSHV
jgi:hypothetical protein